MRARVDGKYVELDAVPKLDPKKKHTIDAVVDRLKVRPDLQQRLAESFETALRLGEGSARVAFLDEPKREELVFSDKFACRDLRLLGVRSSSRGCSRSTIRSAPARAATASA